MTKSKISCTWFSGDFVVDLPSKDHNEHVHTRVNAKRNRDTKSATEMLHKEHSKVIMHKLCVVFLHCLFIICYLLHDFILIQLYGTD